MANLPLRLCIAVAAVMICARSATADLGSVYVYTMADPKITDELEAGWVKRIAASHEQSDIGDGHFNFYISFSSSAKDDGYHIKTGSFPGTNEPIYWITANKNSVDHALHEIDLGFKQNTLHLLKSGWRKERVKKPVVEKE